MEYDIEVDEPVSMAVVRAVSAVTGQDPCSIQPLAYVLDPDALDALFTPGMTDSPRTQPRLSFAYCDCRVSVDDEILTIEPLERGRRPSAEGDSPGNGSE